MAMNRDQVLALHARLTAERAKTRVASQKRKMEVMQLMMYPSHWYQAKDDKKIFLDGLMEFFGQELCKSPDWETGSIDGVRWVDGATNNTPSTENTQPGRT